MIKIGSFYHLNIPKLIDSGSIRRVNSYKGAIVKITRIEKYAVGYPIRVEYVKTATGVDPSLLSKSFKKDELIPIITKTESIYKE